MTARVVAFPRRQPEPWRAEVAARVERHQRRRRRHWARIVSDVLDSPWPGLTAITVAMLWVAAAVLVDRFPILPQIAGGAAALVGSVLVVAIAAVWPRR